LDNFIRHCERSEAIQSFWIAASAFGLLAMTILIVVIPAKAGIHGKVRQQPMDPGFRRGDGYGEFAVEAQKLVGILLKGNVG
jgi:hypothetical protein